MFKKDLRSHKYEDDPSDSFGYGFVLASENIAYFDSYKGEGECNNPDKKT